MIRTHARRTAGRCRYVLLLILVLATGCGALRRPGPAVDRTQDPRIRQDVESRLLAEPAIDAGQVRVEVDGGVVRLYGSVQGIEGWQCAIRNAQLVTGVSSVVDFLVIERAARGRGCLAPSR